MEEPVKQPYIDRKQIEAIATTWHHGQTRKDGKPYITHPIAVADIALYIIMTLHGYATSKEQIEFYDRNSEYVVSGTAILHDVLEDSACTEEDLKIYKINPLTIEAVSILNKNRYSNYYNYINSIASGTPLYVPTNVARIVKYSDIIHNLHKQDNKHKADKYRFAIDVLYRTFSEELAHKNCVAYDKIIEHKYIKDILDR